MIALLLALTLPTLAATYLAMVLLTTRMDARDEMRRHARRAAGSHRPARLRRLK